LSYGCHASLALYDPFEAEPVFTADAPEAIALYEKTQRRRGNLTKEEKASLQAQIDTIQNDHGQRRVAWE